MSCIEEVRWYIDEKEDGYEANVHDHDGTVIEVGELRDTYEAALADVYRIAAIYYRGEACHQIELLHTRIERIEDEHAKAQKRVEELAQVAKRLEKRALDAWNALDTITELLRTIAESPHYTHAQKNGAILLVAETLNKLRSKIFPHETGNIPF